MYIKFHIYTSVIQQYWINSITDENTRFYTTPQKRINSFIGSDSLVNSPADSQSRTVVKFEKHPGRVTRDGFLFLVGFCSEFIILFGRILSSGTVPYSYPALSPCYWFIFFPGDFITKLSTVRVRCSFVTLLVHYWVRFDVKIK